MNILVTGGAGFIGSWVVDRLVKDHNNHVTVLDNLSTGSTRNIKEYEHLPNFKFVKGDLEDTKILEQVFQQKFDLCLHLAAAVHVHESLEKPRKYVNNNIIGILNLLLQCKEQNTKFVFVSSCMVYDAAADKKITESHPTKPSSPYAASKIGAEQLALSFYYSYKLPVTILRPFNTYGPRQASYYEGDTPTFMGVVATFIRRAKKGEKLFIYGDGTQTRDLLYVDDCVDFIMKAAFSDKVNGQIVHAGTGHDVAVKDLALMIADKSMIEFIPHHHPQSEIGKLICDYSKAEKVLGWHPKTTLAEGIKKTRAWLDEFA